MKRLCEQADVNVDGDYLKPHGARRGLDRELYANGHAELAQYFALTTNGNRAETTSARTE